MYVRFTYLQFVADKAGEAREIYYNELIPSIRQQDGLIDVMLLQPLDDADDYISCTMWKNKDAADAYQSGDSYSQDFSKIKELTIKKPVVKYYDVEKP